VVESLTEFVNDVSTLAELQIKLAKIDLHESLARAAIPAALVGLGGLLMLGALPVALLGVADLISSAGFSPGWSRFLTGVVALVTAGLIVALAGLRLSRSFSSFRRSNEELVRNLSWIKTVIVYSGRSSRSGRR